jgi:hypothetical protein
MHLIDGMKIKILLKKSYLFKERGRWVKMHLIDGMKIQILL